MPNLFDPAIQAVQNFCLLACSFGPAAGYYVPTTSVTFIKTSKVEGGVGHVLHLSLIKTNF
jgi:hypothetical protein